MFKVHFDPAESSIVQKLQLWNGLESNSLIDQLLWARIQPEPFQFSLAIACIIPYKINLENEADQEAVVLALVFYLYTFNLLIMLLCFLHLAGSYASNPTVPDYIVGS